MLSGLNERSYSLFYKDICLNIIHSSVLYNGLWFLTKGLLYTILHQEMEQSPLAKNASDIS